MCSISERRPFGVAILIVASVLAVTLSNRSVATDDCLFGDPELPISCDTCLIDDGGCCATDPGCCLLSDRQYLLDDCFGMRSQLGERGINFQANLTQFNFGVVGGGIEEDFRYGGHGDYVMNVDASKMGGPQGLFVTIRAEHRFGETVNSATGATLPATVLPELPVFGSEDLYLTNVLFTQALSHNFAVFAGKLDALSGDANAFAHQRGMNQFSNLAFVGSPIVLRTAPYSTLGAGFVLLEEGHPIFTFSILNPTDTARNSGLGELFAEGVSLVAELRLPTEFFGLPGHQLFGGSWSSREYVSLGQDPRVILPDVPIERSSGSWSLYWNFDQHLVVDRCDPTKGWGVFGRAGIADADTNPIRYFLSFGVGGNSPIPGRSADGFGAGWYYSGTSNQIGPLLTAALGPIGDGQGVELFYRYQVTPWFHVTPDFQALIPARENVDTAYVLGLRTNITF